MLRNLRTRAYSLLGLPAPQKSVILLNRQLTVREGTLRAAPDYDDAWLLACALHSSIVFDIGANVGATALVTLLSDSVQHLILVEPNPQALALAAEQLIHNQLSARVNFVCAFAGEELGATTEFWTVGTGAAGSIFPEHARTASAAGQTITVSTTTVDALCALYHVVPDLIKVDVEGAESMVLAGSHTCARQHKTRFLVELHSNPALSMLDNAADVLDWCQATGYQAWYLKTASQLNAPAQIADRGRCHLLLQPADWAYPDWLRGIEQGANLHSALS